jgi:hypothetical protein
MLTVQVVAHDLDLAVATRLVQRAQRDVVGASSVGPHRRQGQNPGARVPDGVPQPHPIDHVECRAADVDRVPAHPQIGPSAPPARADGHGG